MDQMMDAVYRDGVFVPVVPCDLPNETRVEVILRKPRSIPPVVIDPEERQRILSEMFARMDQNPWPLSRKFTRDELHERR